MRFLPVVLFLSFTAALPVPQAHAQAQDQSGYTLDDNLLYRINFGSAEDVRVLLEKGANPNARNKQGETALEVAFQRNDGESSGMSLALVDKGASIDVPDSTGNPPIFGAIKYRQFKVVKLLMDKGVDLHLKSAEGVPLFDYAKVYGDPDTLKLLQDMLDKEKANADRLRDPNRFKEIVKIYTNDSCLYQYWSFFLSSRQAPEKAVDTQKKIDEIKHNIYQLISQIQLYYAAASTNALRNVSSQAVQKMYNELNAMISNSNRADNGVGSEEDANKRCDKIINSLNIEFVPAVLSSNAQNAAAAAAAQSGHPPPAPSTPPPMPMDPSHTH